MNQQINLVDVAKYAKVESREKHLILQWEEPRDIFRVVVKPNNSLQSEAKLQYWQNSWPQTRIPSGEKLGASRTGWMAQDDWFNGKWKDTDTEVKVEDDRLIYTFNPINITEFPDEDFDAVYRRTLKIRLIFEEERQEIESIEAYTDSVWKETEVRIEWGNEFAKENWQGHFEVYNGELEGISALTDSVNVDEENRFRCDGKPGCIRLRLRYAYNEDINSFDKTIVTLRSTAESFSFLVDDVESGKKIFVKDFDALVTKAADDIDYGEFRQEWEANHSKNLYERIKKLPEQTLQNAFNDMPKKKRFYIVLGCEGGRQKFGVDPNGDVFCPENWIRKR